MEDWGGKLTQGNIKPKSFASVNRMPGDLKWEESVQYDRFGRGKVVSHIKATFGGRLKSEVPDAGFVTAVGIPCHEDSATAKPVWIWWADVE